MEYLFSYSYNQIESAVILDTRREWKLVFLKRGVGKTLEIPIEKGYMFTIRGNELYKRFIQYFGIGYKKGEFSINNFVSCLQKDIPEECIWNISRRKDKEH